MSDKEYLKRVVEALINIEILVRKARQDIEEELHKERIGPLEIQQKCIELMRIREILKCNLDPRIAKPLFEVQQKIVNILRKEEIENGW